MPVLMPCEPGSPRRIDPAWDRERQVLLGLGGTVLLLDHDRLQAGDAEGALARTALPAFGTLAWRGWMVRPDSYALLEAALHARGLRLLTDAQAYARTHLLPGTLEALRPWSVPAVLLPAGRPGAGALHAALAGFGTRVLVVKDWVKSQADLWDEACFIPRADDAGHALAVIARFLDLQGPDLQGGVVLREWRPLVQRAGRAVE